MCDKSREALDLKTLKRIARLDFRLPAEMKQEIEEAAAQLGQSVSDFAVSTLVQAARNLIREQSVTQLTYRDRNMFVALLDDVDANPNNTLKAAARRFKRKVGSI